MELAFIHRLRSHWEPDEFSTGWNLVRLGVPFTRNHLSRTKILTPGSSKFRVNGAKILNHPVWTKCQVKLYSRSKIRPVSCEKGLIWRRYCSCDLHNRNPINIMEKRLVWHSFAENVIFTSLLCHRRSCPFRKRSLPFLRHLEIFDLLLRVFLWKRKKIATQGQTRRRTRTLRILMSLPYHWHYHTDPPKIPKNLSKYTNKLSFLTITSITGHPSP